MDLGKLDSIEVISATRDGQRPDGNYTLDHLRNQSSSKLKKKDIHGRSKARNC
jgi:hypothetical protein